MKPNLTRREFIKTAGIYTASAALPGFFLKSHKSAAGKNKPNFLIIVFDAWSASNMSLYGYPRKTTPKLELLAERQVGLHF